MAGSKRWFKYTTNEGNVYGANLDESNTEAVNGTSGALPATPRLTEGVPRNITLRRAYYVSDDGNRRISVVCVTPAIYDAVEGTTPTLNDPIAGSGTLKFDYKRPELFKPSIKYRDTGLLDGDSEAVTPTGGAG